MKKLIFICMALVLALGALGVGYAKWSDTVTIEGSISTGTVKIGIFDWMTNDSAVGNLDPMVAPADPWMTPELVRGLVPYVLVDRKDVARAVSENGLPAECVCLAPWGAAITHYNSVTETITNAYPFYVPYLILSLANCGTIPVIIEDFCLQVTSGNPDILDCIAFYWQAHPNIEGVPTGEITGIGIDTLEEYLLGTQLHTCDWMEVKIQMVFLECTPQDSNVAFTITVTGSQYNEANPG